MSRDFSKISWEKVNQDLSNNPLIQSTLNSHEVNNICDNLILAIQNTLDDQQKEKRIQINKKYPTFASKETIETIEQRNQAMIKMKSTTTIEYIRNYRTLRNRCHKMIRQDKEKSLSEKFKEVEDDRKQAQWQTTKSELGWTKNLSPTTLTKDGKTIQDPISIANAINFSQISKNNKLHRNIPKTNTDYRDNYRKLVAGKHLEFQLRTITMGQLRNEIKNMKPTNSAGMDGISTKTLKKMIKPLHPTLLNLVNKCIETATYPEALKTARIIPLLKKDKPETEANSYRAVNILPSIGKLIDRVVNRQIIQHLEVNKLFLHQHNGAIKGRSTMTAVLSMLDDWANDLENGKENAILVLDQSAAYDVISHVKLLEKIKILGWDRNAILFFTSYLSNRRQSVTVDNFQSEILYTGPLSVCQGSTLSGLLYLIYTLDYPLIHNSRKLNIQEYDESEKPKTTTFVDDSICKIQLPKNNGDNNRLIKNTLDKITDYMNANSLVINQDKSKIMIITKNKKTRDEISIKIENKNEPIQPVRNMKYLGIMIQDDLMWNQFLKDGPDNLEKRLKQKINAIKCIRKYLSTKTTRILMNGVFMSHILYGATLWGGAPQYLINRIQSTQLEACRTTIGHISKRWSTRKLLKEMGWLSIKQNLQNETAKTTHKIINNQEPEHMAFKMNMKFKNPNQPNTRMSGNGKLGNKPTSLGKTKTSRNHYRNYAYLVYQSIPEELTNIKTPYLFKRWYKRYLNNPKNLPSSHKLKPR